MLTLDASGAEGQLVAGGAPFVGGNQGSVGDGRRERAYGQAQHHDEVEVERNAHGDGADEHSVAETTNSAEVGLEFEGQRPGEDVERDRTFHSVEGGEPVEGGVD